MTAAKKQNLDSETYESAQRTYEASVRAWHKQRQIVQEEFEQQLEAYNGAKAEMRAAREELVQAVEQVKAGGLEPVVEPPKPDLEVGEVAKLYKMVADLQVQVEQLKSGIEDEAIVETAVLRSPHGLSPIAKSFYLQCTRQLRAQRRYKSCHLPMLLVMAQQFGHLQKFYKLLFKGELITQGQLDRMSALEASIDSKLIAFGLAPLEPAKEPKKKNRPAKVETESKVTTAIGSKLDDLLAKVSRRVPLQKPQKPITPPRPPMPKPQKAGSTPKAKPSLSLKRPADDAETVD